MRVLLAALGVPQQLYPHVPLAWALRAAGHEVRVAATPALIDSVTTAGLPCVAVGLESVVDDLIAFVRWWRPDLVLRGIDGVVVAEAIGMPNVPTLTLDPSPPGLRLPVSRPYREIRYVPYDGAGVAPDWADRPGDRPRICVTHDNGDPYRLVRSALSDVDAEVVPAAAPLHVLLQHCSLIVHHGGEGTTLTAAVRGVPQLIIYDTPEEDQLSHRLVTTGAAMRLRAKGLAGEADPATTIRDAVDKLLADSSYLDAAARLAEQIKRQPAPAELVPVLEALAGLGG
jgi:UDP:flavonoid glycosyltransferase YjiC (YdhE family)